MKKNILACFMIIALAALLILTSGLQGCNKTQGTTFNTTALTMSFVQDAPPTELMSSKPGGYSIDVDIANTGGARIAARSSQFLSKRLCH